MTTVQRRRGQPALIYKSKTITDSRGNKVAVVDEANPYSVLVWTFAQRSSIASVPGQQDIDVVRFGTTADLSGVYAWSQIEYKGHRYDVVAPPSYHNGIRQTRHWAIDARRRPSG